MTTDDAWAHVHRFQLRIDNLGRIGDLRTQLIEMVESGDWRDYTSAIGHQRWRAAEFDYFLIDCGVSHEDDGRGDARVAAAGADVPRGTDRESARVARTMTA